MTLLPFLRDMFTLFALIAMLYGWTLLAHAFGL